MNTRKKRSRKPKDGAGAAPKKRKQGEDPQTSTDKNPEKPQMSRKVFMDPIHGSIDLHPLCVKIVDTPEFQRLRWLKQLGGGYFVYPGASHNRFEHSLGVCFLAGKLLRSIKQRQPELKINEEDILCVEIAGLCHDLGHGPFSHLFDKLFIPGIEKENDKKTTEEKVPWKHEKASVAMLTHMLEKDSGALEKNFKEFGLLGSHIEFIKKLITGEKDEKQKWTYEGRTQNKSFLYDIVANLKNGIDVDKWDYFARDCHMLGIKNSFDHMRCIQFARVIDVDGNLQICFRDKEAVNLYGMFHTRWGLYHRAYQHRVTKIIENMITEAMMMADGHLKFEGKNGLKRKMSEAIDDMVAYRRLTDDVFLQILNSNSSEPQMKKAKELLEKVQRRELYKFVAHAHVDPKKKLDIDKLKKEINGIIETKEPDSARRPNPESIVILPATMDYGDGANNPMEKVRFYRKRKPDVGVKIKQNQVSWMLPSKFAETWLRVHSKESDEKLIEMIKDAFSKLCERDDDLTYEGDDNPSDNSTPERQ